MKLKTLFVTIILAVTAVTGTLSGCKDNDLWGDLPSEISQFITQYFPSSDIDSFSESSNTYHVRLKDGPGMTFNKNYDWETINGYGMPLPEVLLFDQLPPALYSYLEETSNLGSVFSMERDKASYTIVLLDTTLHYDIETEEITGSPAEQS
ncbi:MAG: hypothetical protein K2I89_05360 [Muribaculaceae bacterium]|nr:hypothetical protein [Muribaculaceae bacterium]